MVRRVSKWQISCDGWYPFCEACGEEPPGRQMSRYCPNCGSFMEKDTINLYDIEEIHNNCTVQIWKNSVTGEESTGWWKNERDN